MQSRTAQFFHDHVLVKEPGTQKPTPWHQDIPYYFVDGQQTVSFWIPIDPVKEATLRLIAGSHKWDKMILPVRWLDDSNFYAGEGDYLPVPDPDKDPSMKVLEWEMEPGDAILFDFRTAHGARGNHDLGTAPGAVAALGRRRCALCRAARPHLSALSRPRHEAGPETARGLVPGRLPELIAAGNVRAFGARSMR